MASQASQAPKGTLFASEISEKTIQKWRMIQIVTVLPLLLAVILMFLFEGSIMGTFAFFLIVIVGVLLPQVYRDLVQSHLILKSEIEDLKKQLSGKSQEAVRE